MSLLEKYKSLEISLNRGIRAKENEESSLKKYIEFFSDFDNLAKISKEVSNLDEDIAALTKTANIEKNRFEKNTKHIQVLDKKIQQKSGFFKNFFGKSSELKELIQQRANYLNSVEASNSKMLAINTALTEKKNRHSDLKENLDAAENFDLKEKMFEVLSLSQEIKALKTQLSHNQKLTATFKNALSKEYSLLEQLQEELSEAEDFDYELSTAKNSYYRRQIHDDIELRFGTGSAKEIIRDRTNKISNLEKAILRNEEKILSKHQQDISRHNIISNCKKLFIDGNNLCYKNHDEFIGLKALHAIVKTLLPNFSLHLIFDKSITNILDIKFSTIQNSFPDHMEVSLQLSHTEADHSLITLCSVDITSYILSNDRFIDYYNFDAVKNGHILGVQIFDKNILIPSLDINIEY